VGECAYKVRRGLRRYCGKEWQADFWAIYAYSQIGCPDDFKDFLKRHPEKTKFIWFLMLGVWKTRLINAVRNLLHRFKPNTPT